LASTLSPAWKPVTLSQHPFSRINEATEFQWNRPMELKSSIVSGRMGIFIERKQGKRSPAAGTIIATGIRG
jgi:hypothetical protein